MTIENKNFITVHRSGQHTSLITKNSGKQRTLFDYKVLCKKRNLKVFLIWLLFARSACSIKIPYQFSI